MKDYEYVRAKGDLERFVRLSKFKQMSLANNFNRMPWLLSYYFMVDIIVTKDFVWNLRWT